MIAGIGADIVEIKRFKTVTDVFLVRTFTEAELEIYYSRNKCPSFLAINFAGKEAVAKALGTGFRGFSPIDVEILRACGGNPVVNLNRGALAAAAAQNITSVHISLSDTAEYAAAFVVLERVP